jgi:dipeptidase E
MRLYLSSYGLGNRPEELARLAGSLKKAALVLNALDNAPGPRNRILEEQKEGMERLGFQVEEIDLRDYFGDPRKLSAKLKDKEIVWVTGGNTFILRRAMKESGFDRIITDRIKNDSILYGGFSAGVVVLTKDLHGIDITDDPYIVPPGYLPGVIWSGLGILDFSIAVHYQSNHPESHLTDKEIEYYEQNHIPFRTLKDGQVLIKKGEHICLLE